MNVKNKLANSEISIARYGETRCEDRKDPIGAMEAHLGEWKLPLNCGGSSIAANGSFHCEEWKNPKRELEASYRDMGSPHCGQWDVPLWCWGTSIRESGRHLTQEWRLPFPGQEASDVDMGCQPPGEGKPEARMSVFQCGEWRIPFVRMEPPHARMGKFPIAGLELQPQDENIPLGTEETPIPENGGFHSHEWKPDYFP